MLRPKLTTPDQFVGDFPLQFHAKLEHLVVGVAGKHDFPGVELVNGGAKAPQVDIKVVF